MIKIAVLLAVWFFIGAFAANQRGYFENDPDDCAGVGTILVNVLAGPLNYVGANPKVDCEVPQPSS